NQAGIDNRALAQQQALGGQVIIDGGKDGARQMVALEQAAELEECGGIRRRLAAKINADKAANGVAVVERIFHALIGEPKALLRDIHPQHALQSNGWPPAPTTFGIKRLQLSKQGRPGRE